MSLEEETEFTDADYEAIGRAAMGFLNATLLGHEVSVDELVQRSAEQSRCRVESVLWETVVPLSKLAGKPGTGPS